jgi:hypothetical protein
MVTPFFTLILPSVRPRRFHHDPAEDSNDQSRDIQECEYAQSDKHR